MPDSEPRGPELVLGLVGAVGTDLDMVSAAFEQNFTDCEYQCKRIHIIELLHAYTQFRNLEEKIFEERVHTHMDAGDEFRDDIGENALAVLSVGAIRDFRKQETSDASKPAQRYVYILKSLKHPQEVHTLRKIYGSVFILVSAYSPKSQRIEYLKSKIADSHSDLQTEKYLPEAERLNKRDKEEEDKPYGQNVSKTFPLADVFIDVTDRDRLLSSVKRFVEIFLGHPYHTPTRDEYGMFHARAARFRSGSLSRQVGAVIATYDGDIIAVGTNEVPKAGGGLYWEGDSPDFRDHVKGYDISHQMKKRVLGDIFKRLRDAKWFKKNRTDAELDALIEESLTGPLKGTHVMNLIEFYRSVHAEMAALMDAARRGVRVQGATMYVTTFPCHHCAKHIVAAGISRVVYVEPYPKSLTPQLYLDSIKIDCSTCLENAVSFEPFVGVSFRLFAELFTMSERKTKDGLVVSWNKQKAVPRIKGSAIYLTNEVAYIKDFRQKLREKGYTQEGDEQ